MDQRSTVLAALAVTPGQALTRVQAQKLLFLIDRQLAPMIGGEAFSFAPYHYGPYDSDVYRTMERLIAEGALSIVPQPGAGSAFTLTDSGRATAAPIIQALPPSALEHMNRLGIWVRSLSFVDLVGAIYRAYPEMRARSIFRS